MINIANLFNRLLKIKISDESKQFNNDFDSYEQDAQQILDDQTKAEREAAKPTVLKVKKITVGDVKKAIQPHLDNIEHINEKIKKFNEYYTQRYNEIYSGFVDCNTDETYNLAAEFEKTYNGTHVDKYIKSLEDNASKYKEITDKLEYILDVTDYAKDKTEIDQEDSGIVNVSLRKLKEMSEEKTSVNDINDKDLYEKNFKQYEEKCDEIISNYQSKLDEFDDEDSTDATRDAEMIWDMISAMFEYRNLEESEISNEWDGLFYFFTKYYKDMGYSLSGFRDGQTITVTEKNMNIFKTKDGDVKPGQIVTSLVKPGLKKPDGTLAYKMEVTVK